VIPSKRQILDQLLLEIKTAGTILEDNFSHEELKLEREHLAKQEELQAKTKSLVTSYELLETREQKQLELIAELESKESTLRSSVTEISTQISNGKREAEAYRVEVNQLRSDETTLKNSIDALKDQKQVAQDAFDVQVGDNQNTLSLMQSNYRSKQTELDKQIEIANDKLHDLQHRVLLHTNKMIALEEEQKQKDNDLIQRENAIIIKTKALAKDQAEFDHEIKRWGYIKPTEK